MFGFQLATRSPIFTHSLKNASKLVLKVPVYYVASKQIQVKKNVRVNHLRENLPRGVENSERDHKA